MKTLKPVSLEAVSIEIVFFDAGGGHRSAANALCEVAKLEKRPWDMRMMNLQELLDEMDVFRKLTGIRLQDIYNLILQRGWTLGSTQLLPLMHGVIRVLHGKQVKLLTEYWKDRRPDMIVSVIPNFNRALFEAAQIVMPDVPMVTILTDFADFPPHFWIERQPQYFICGTERAYRQALEMGHPKERVFLTSGMILNPRFYEPVDVTRNGNSNLPTALLMFGGEGSTKMLDIVRKLNDSSVDLKIIAICGKNNKLEADMRAMPSRIPIQIEGFTREVPRFMRMADFFIGKPGPGSISEAVAMGLPVIVECNSWTLPQERYNSQWVEEQRVGIALTSFRGQIVDAVQRMTDPKQRCVFKTNVSALNNRAVFEIPQILDQILQGTRAFQTRS